MVVPSLHRQEEGTAPHLGMVLTWALQVALGIAISPSVTTTDGWETLLGK